MKIFQSTNGNMIRVYYVDQTSLSASLTSDLGSYENQAPLWRRDMPGSVTCSMH